MNEKGWKRQREILKFEAKSLEAPKLPSFFKSKGPNQFNYKPWYYNEAKEERKNRNRLIKAEFNAAKRTNKENFESRLHAKWHLSDSGNEQRSKSNIRLIAIIVLLAWFAYYLLK